MAFSIPHIQSAVVQPAPRAELESRTVPVPRPAAGDVLVRVEASTLHSLDFKILRYGIMAPEWPYTPGLEFAGTVVDVGLGVQALRPGDRIVAVTAGFLEGNEVSGWQQYALAHANLCTKIPDSLSFALATTVPVSFVTASIALALDLGLKYPPPPAAPPHKTAANIWSAALASLNKNQPAFEFDIEDGVIQDGSWYPSEKAMHKYARCSGINGAVLPTPLPTVPSSISRLSEPDRKRILNTRVNVPDDRTYRLSADDNGLAPIPFYPRPTRDSSPVPQSVRSAPARPRTRLVEPIDLSDPWANVHPMSLGTGDLSREAMDRRFGSGWNEPDRAPRLVEIIENSSSGSGSTSMGRSASDGSYTSVDEQMSASYPNLRSSAKGTPSVGRRGSEPILRRGSGSGAGSGGGPSPGPRGAAPASSANARGKGGSGRGSTSPFRVPPMSHRRQASPPYTYRARELSPTPAVGPPRPLSAGNRAGGPRPTPLNRPLSALEELIYHGRTIPPLEAYAYTMDEPVLIWGGGTSVGHSALQILKKVGYTNVLVVASGERHLELKEIAPVGARFFDYHDPDVVLQIQTALGDQSLRKVLDAVSLPYTLKQVAQVVSPGAVVVALLPVNTPMPDGVELKMAKFAKCHNFDGKDVAAATFGRTMMWPLLGEMLQSGEYVFPKLIHLRGGVQACATRALGMVQRGENVGARLVFSV